MKNLDLNAYGVCEMSQSELVGIDGGNVFKAVANAIASAAVAVYDAIVDTFSDMEITWGGFY